MAVPFDIDTWQAGGKTYNDDNGIKDTPFQQYWSDLPSLRKGTTTTTLHVEGHSFLVPGKNGRLKVSHVGHGWCLFTIYVGNE
jgi:hypothetical protein